MTRLIFLTILSFISLFCAGQKTNSVEVNSENNCRGTWQYFSLQGTIKGQVLFHTKASVHCGVLATASLTIIRTMTNDTIRVLELCNTSVYFKNFARVEISPNQRPSFNVLIPFDNKDRDCQVVKTCYGSIKYL